MENREYYTPEIFELFVGYELEFRTLVREDIMKDPHEIWQKVTLNKSNFDSNRENWYNPFVSNIRTKYLCKQDIIDLGFKKVSYKHPFLGNVEGYEKHLKTDEFNELSCYRIVKHPKSEIIEVHKIYESSWGSQNEQIFNGFCKSKNELKKLMKDYLNIPI